MSRVAFLVALVAICVIACSKSGPRQTGLLAYRSAPVTMEVGGNVVATDPTAEQLKNMLGSLRDDTNSFFILSRSPGSYMQGALHEGKGIYLEYQAGGTQHHFAAKSHVSKEQALAVVSSYAQGEDAWLKLCEWVRLKI